jgi:insulysin
MPKMEEEMERPKLDDCSYRVVTLQNQLEVLFVHDAGTDIAGATLDVNVGSFSDTDDMPSIAHAVEHLLSMGTEKYPRENSYEAFLSQHGGLSNASTAPTSTQYYFKLLYPTHTAAGHASRPNASYVNDKSPLLGALDRFGQFFISPLFLEAAVSREINSIHSEFQKKIQDDIWRVQQVKMALANPKHPYSRFTMGNLQTLYDDEAVRGEVAKFFSTRYSANRMKLVVFGRESLNTLQEWVEEIFAEIPNKNLSQSRWDVPLYTTDALLTQTFVKPVGQWRSLELQFMHRDEEEFYEIHPSRYMTHLLNHKGPGSLFAYFRANGWATEIDAGGYAPCPGAGLYSINVELTEKGLKHYREVVKVIFHYIAMVRGQPPQNFKSGLWTR